MNAKGLLALVVVTVVGCGNADEQLGAEGEAAKPSELDSSAEELSSDEGDYYNCFAGSGCASPALSTSTRCLKGRDYKVTVNDAQSDVVVLSIHGGLIEPNSSELAQAISSKLHYSLYDFAAHGTAACLGTLNDFNRLHITAANFDDPTAVRLVGRHKKAVAIHGYNDSRGNDPGTLCVGGSNAKLVQAFIAAVNQRKSRFTLYSLRPIDAATATASRGADCTGITGTARANLVNRTLDGAGGLQLEMSDAIKADLLNPSTRYDALRTVFYGALSAAMN